MVVSENHFALWKCVIKLRSTKRATNPRSFRRERLEKTTRKPIEQGLMLRCFAIIFWTWLFWFFLNLTQDPGSWQIGLDAVLFWKKAYECIFMAAFNATEIPYSRSLSTSWARPEWNRLRIRSIVASLSRFHVTLNVSIDFYSIYPYEVDT